MMGVTKDHPTTETVPGKPATEGAPLPQTTENLITVPAAMAEVVVHSTEPSAVFPVEAVLNWPVASSYA